MPPPKLVIELVERFDSHGAHYRSAEYKEDQLRQEFLNPLFEELGWDMANREGNAPQYRDVIHEDAIKIGGHNKAPDYCFRIGGTRKFFLEAKKPAVALKNNPDPAYQLRRYAWSAALPVSILTNFAEFAVYDCRKKPTHLDKASAGRVNYYTHDQFVTHWDEIAGIFSKNAILKGSFDKYAESTKGKRGTATVDGAFLAEIEGWREELAKNLAARNPDLEQRELNFAVQVTIDRIIFLRMCEDRGIEPYGQLQKQLDHDGVYKGLLELFRLADHKYNSGLFHFEKEPQRDDPDGLTPDLKIDDKVLKGIIGGLYYPECPYEFSALPADILGQVYEQFLGKVIRLTAGHHAKVEDKPEVKKAGGVYYTPSYIVQYIVEQTVGKLLGAEREGEAPAEPRSIREGEAPAEPESLGSAGASPSRKSDAITPAQAAKLRILDPACGSGSFLLGAFQYLIDWHRNWYEQDGPDQHKKELVALPGGGYRLSNSEKKRILVNNIYGVDIDPQAVEVTKLSLLLKVLEAETSATLFAKDRALPDLDRNIRCGNSLIGPDFYDGRLFPDEDERLRINAFDWQGAFPKIMKAGGFDAVIGNPPYVRIQRIPHDESDYYFGTYLSPTSKTDLSLLFIEKAFDLINDAGSGAFICTSQWLATDYGRNLRGMLSDGRLHEIVDFGSLPVFAGASTYPAIFTIGRKKASRLHSKRVSSVINLNLEGIKNAEGSYVDLATLSTSPWSLGRFNLCTRLDERRLIWKPISAFGKAYIGTKSGMTDVFVLETKEATRLGLETKLLIPYAYQGEEVRRYEQVEPNSVIIYPYLEKRDGKATLIPEREFRDSFPKIYAYLLQHKDALVGRQDSRKSYATGHSWYRHLRAGRFSYIRPEKITVKGIARRLSTGVLRKNTAFDGANCPSILFRDRAGYDLNYFLGLLNSRLLSFHLRTVCPPKLSGYTRFSASCIALVPIRVINRDSSKELKSHDRIVTLVERMLTLHAQLAKAKAPPVRAGLQGQIDSTDREIDRIVYDLYGLTEEEITIVEEATSK